MDIGYINVSKWILNTLMYPISILIISVYDYGSHVKILLIIIYHYRVLYQKLYTQSKMLLRMGEFVARNKLS